MVELSLDRAPQDLLSKHRSPGVGGLFIDPRCLRFMAEMSSQQCVGLILLGRQVHPHVFTGHIIAATGRHPTPSLETSPSQHPFFFTCYSLSGKNL